MAADPLPGSTRAKDQALRFREAIEKIRSRTDLTAKGLAAVGTAAVTAIGYAKFADVFPYGGPLWALFGLGAGVLLMIFAVVYLVRRFLGASETVVTRPSIQGTISQNEFDEKERELIEDSYSRLATMNGVESMQAYQARAHRFERIAEHSQAEKAAALRARADQIMSEILATQDRAGALVLRKRANRATFGKGTWIFLGVFVAGWYLTAISADALQSKRSGEVEAAKVCAEVRELGTAVEGKLPSICGDAPESEETTAAKVADDAVTALATARGECREKAEEADEDLAICQRLDRALAASLETLP